MNLKGNIITTLLMLHSKKVKKLQSEKYYFTKYRNTLVAQQILLGFQTRTVSFRSGD